MADNQVASAAERKTCGECSARCCRLRGFLTIFSFIFLFAVFFALVIGFMWCGLRLLLFAWRCLLRFYETAPLAW